MEILTTTWVVPGDGSPLREGLVAVEAGRVAWVGERGDPGCPRGERRDLGPGVLVPGLVNAHCHLELSHLGGELPTAGGFVPWVESVVALRGRLPAEEIRSRTREAIRFLEERGTVAVGDVSNSLAHLDLLAASELRGVVFFELLAWDPERAEATLRGALERLATLPVRVPGWDVRLAAHAPHSVSAELLRDLAERGPGAIHLAESREEVRFLASGDGPWATFLEHRGLGHVSFEAPGVSPTRYLDALGFLGPGLVAAHAVHVDRSDCDLLARSGVFVVLCPRSNRTLGVGSPDVASLLAAGVRLALGTDSLASVESLDVLEDAALLVRSSPHLDPASILRMATAGGAAALGLSDLGTIAPGKRAALAFARTGSPPSDPWALLFAEGTTLCRVSVE